MQEWHSARDMVIRDIEGTIFHQEHRKNRWTRTDDRWHQNAIME
jgi:hypothetical protein